MKNDKFLVGAPSLRAICDLSSVIGHRAAAVHGAPSVTVRFEEGSFAGLTAQKWNHRAARPQPKTWRFFASSWWSGPGLYHEDAKNQEEFSISRKILSS